MEGREAFRDHTSIFILSLCCHSTNSLKTYKYGAGISLPSFRSFVVVVVSVDNYLPHGRSFFSQFLAMLLK